MSDFLTDLLERTARESDYSAAELERHFDDLVNGDGVSVSDFVWLAVSGML